MPTGRAAPDPVLPKHAVENGVANGRRMASHRCMAQPWPADTRKCRFAGISVLHLDVVHRHARVPVLAFDDVGDRRLGEDVAGCCGGRLEDAFGTGTEWAVEELDDLQDRDR